MEVAGTIVPSIAVQTGRIDLAAEIVRIESDPRLLGAVGGFVSFTGYCRDEGGRLKALELEHYPGMAERELEKVAREAISRWPLLACRAVHRYGIVLPGEQIVLVACASAHRDAAFAAASFFMDFLKTRAPFWKREHLADGTIGEWIGAKETDAAAAGRWVS